MVVVLRGEKMDKERLLYELNHAMTVGNLIKQLEQYDKDTIVINGKDKNYLPVLDAFKTKVDYCYDEIISREVVEIW